MPENPLPFIAVGGLYRWDNNNSNFRVLGLEATWFAGGSNDLDIELLHHNDTGWTYNVGAEPTPPTALASIDTDHSTDDNTVNGENGAWKRSDLSTTIEGNDSEGILFKVTTNAARQIEVGNFELQIRPD